MDLFFRNGIIYTNNLSNSNSNKVRMIPMNDKIREYKKEITFLIDKQAKIYYHKIDLMHDHEDLLIENGFKTTEFEVCRLVYDPNQPENCSFCGIPGVFASCNVLFDALPFELKSTHLNAIENWIKQYDEIVKYSEEHAEEYDPDHTAEFIRSMNRIFLAEHQEILGNFANVCKEWQKWVKDYPVLKYLDQDKEIYKLQHSDLIGQFFRTADKVEYNDYLQDCIERAQEKYKRISIENCSSFIEEKPIEMPGSTETHKIIRVEQKIDLARFIEVSNQIIQDSGEPGGFYFIIGGQLLYNVITKIAERACEIKDEEILRLLEKLKMVEPEEGESFYE